MFDDDSFLHESQFMLLTRRNRGQMYFWLLSISWKEFLSLFFSVKLIKLNRHEKYFNIPLTQLHFCTTAGKYSILMFTNFSAFFSQHRNETFCHISYLQSKAMWPALRKARWDGIWYTFSSFCWFCSAEKYMLTLFLMTKRNLIVMKYFFFSRFSSVRGLSHKWRIYTLFSLSPSAVVNVLLVCCIMHAKKGMQWHDNKQNKIHRSS